MVSPNFQLIFFTDITSLVADVLHLRAMTQIAVAQAEDLQKMTEAKLGTLSLILGRVYSNRGDAGLNSFVKEVKDFEELLKFAKDVPLDTPMMFPERLHATTLAPDSKDYHWVADYTASVYHQPPPVPVPAASPLGDSFYGSESDVVPMEVEPSVPAAAPPHLAFSEEPAERVSREDPALPAPGAASAGTVRFSIFYLVLLT